MLTININLFEDEKRLTGTLNGEKFNVKFNSDLYSELVKYQNELKSIENIEDFDIWAKTVIEVLKDTTEDVIVTKCDDLMLDSTTGKYYIKVGTKISSHYVPEKIVSVILESIDKDIDPTPIIKSWIRFLRNPNFTGQKAELFAKYITTKIIDADEVDGLISNGYTREKAINAATYSDVSITQEGLIVAKKYSRLLTKGWVIDPETNEAVKEDLYKTTKTVDQFSGEVTETTDFPEYSEELTFEPPVMGRGGDKFFCGNEEDHIIKVGMKHELNSWDMVNTDDSVSCRPGLHVGGLQYVSAYRGLNAQLLECFVDPADIGAICGLDDFGGSDGAIRVLSYFIYGANKGRTKGIYHSSKYAAMRDDEWEIYKKEAIENADKFKTELVDFDVN